MLKKAIGVFVQDLFLDILFTSLENAKKMYPEDDIEFYEVWTIDGISACRIGDKNYL